MQKYHGQKEIVDGIVADKEAQGAYEVNPDVVSMRLYHCWDSTAVVKSDTTTESQEVVRSTALTGEMASSILSGTKLMIYFFNRSFENRHYVWTLLPVPFRCSEARSRTTPYASVSG